MSRYMILPNNNFISEDELYHWKYIKREKKNGRWVYTYDDGSNNSTMNRKQSAEYEEAVSAIKDRISSVKEGLTKSTNNRVSGKIGGTRSNPSKALGTGIKYLKGQTEKATTPKATVDHNPTEQKVTNQDFRMRRDKAVLTKYSDSSGNRKSKSDSKKRAKDIVSTATAATSKHESAGKAYMENMFNNRSSTYFKKIESTNSNSSKSGSGSISGVINRRKKNYNKIRSNDR